MDEINAITPQQIETLRKNFHEKVASQSPGFHPDDLERVKTDELWLRRFLAHAESNMDTATTLLYDCCQWRKEFGTNELDESKIPAELFAKGVLFIRNQDKWGKKLLIFKAKQHTKGTVDIELLQKFVVYYFERIERETCSDQISIIFDMKDTSWANMDMDFVRYLITLLKTYYPYFVNYLIIFEMPWLLNAAWKIIKGWLPPKFVDRVKFQDKKNLKEYIEVDNQLAEWGGTDNYVFKFEPRGHKNAQKIIPNGGISHETNRNKVQFTGNEVSEIHQFDYEVNASRGNETPSPIQATSGRQMSSPQQSFDNCLADVEDRIVFRSSENDETYSARLTIKNIASQGNTLIVKIKTTSPDRYRVKPIIFILNRNATANINIDTHQGISASTLSRDRFQVQVCIVPSNMLPNSSSELSDASSSSSLTNFGDLGNSFKQIVNREGAVVETYKVAVSVEARPGDSGSGSGNSIALSDERLRRGLEDLEKKITESVSNKVSDKIAKIERLFLISLVVFLLLFIFILTYLYKLSGDCSNVCRGGIPGGQWTESPAGSSCDAK